MRHLLNFVSLSLLCFIGFLACSSQNESHIPLSMTSEENNILSSTGTSKTLDSATFGNGCFWCTEAIFQQLKGVDTVVSGYSGGQIKNPTYKEVCSGLTGHAEVLRIYFNPQIISFTDLLEVFWYTHDPTTLNRQGNDVGTQYRSVVFYHNEEQKKLAELYKKKLTDAKVYDQPIVTEISPVINFYPAEDYHQNYYNLHGTQPYCQFVIRPKLEKFKKAFGGKTK